MASGESRASTITCAASSLEIKPVIASPCATWQPAIRGGEKPFNSKLKKNPNSPKSSEKSDKEKKKIQEQGQLLCDEKVKPPEESPGQLPCR